VLKKDSKRIEKIIEMHIEQHEYLLKQGDKVPRFDRIMEQAIIMHYIDKYKNNISSEKIKYYEQKFAYTEVGAVRLFYKLARKFFD